MDLARGSILYDPIILIRYVIRLLSTFAFVSSDLTQFVSNWSYVLRSPTEDLASGWTLWAGFNQSLYYYMSALDGWEQILTGESIFNFYRAKQQCCVDWYGWQIYPHYFDNATLIHSGPTANTWVGSLYSQPVFGFNVTYFVTTEPVSRSSCLPPELFLSAFLDPDQIWLIGPLQALS